MNDDPKYQRAARGAAFLDKECPGWYRRINLKRLDINNSHCCVLGQLFNDYVTGICRLRCARDREALGFAAEDGAAERALTPIWKALIEERLK